MTWRVVSNRPGMFAPDFHDFTYEQAAEDYRDILREIGRENVTIHQLPDATREKP